MKLQELFGEPIIAEVRIALDSAKVRSEVLWRFSVRYLQSDTRLTPLEIENSKSDLVFGILQTLSLTFLTHLPPGMPFCVLFVRTQPDLIGLSGPLSGFERELERLF